jgi:hypothetical protein
LLDGLDKFHDLWFSLYIKYILDEPKGWNLHEDVPYIKERQHFVHHSQHSDAFRKIFGNLREFWNILISWSFAVYCKLPDKFWSVNRNLFITWSPGFIQV